MRKYIMIFVLTIMVFGISACDLINTETVEKATEEFCLENPNSELCEIDLLDGIEDEAMKRIDEFILDMENSALSNKEVCALWDGVDDDCNGIEETRTKFKVGAELSKKVNILDPDDDGDGILVAAVSYELDGHVTVLKISFDLDTSGKELELSIGDIIAMESEIFTIEEISLLWDSFIKDYHDESISTEEIDAKYFKGKAGDSFIADRKTDFEEGTIIRTSSIDYTKGSPGSLFDIGLEIMNGSDTISSKVSIRVNRIDMALYMSFVNPYEIGYPTYEEALSLLNTYKKGYDYYQSASNNHCASTVVDFQQEDCITERETLKENGLRLIDISLEKKEINYMVTFTYEDDESNQVIKNKIVMFYISGDSYLLAFYDAYVDEINNDEIKVLIEEFTKDAGDTTVLTTNVCHFISVSGNDEDNDCDGIVNEVRDKGLEIDIKDIQDLGDNYIVDFIFRKEGTEYTKQYYFSFYYDEDMIIKAGMNLLDNKLFIYTDIYSLFEKINDFTVTTDEICSTKVHEDSYARCVAIRDYHESNEYKVIVSKIELNDQMNLEVLVITYDKSGNEIEQNTFTMNYLENASGDNPLFIESSKESNNPLYE